MRTLVQGTFYQPSRSSYHTRVLFTNLRGTFLPTFDESRAMARCEFPRCTLHDELVAQACSGDECEGVLHHSCFAQFCHRQSVDDPEGNAYFCWTCVTKEWPAEMWREGSAVRKLEAGTSNSDVIDSNGDGLNQTAAESDIEHPSPSMSSPHSSHRSESPTLPLASSPQNKLELENTL